jgi:hypothetical protein
VSLNRPTAVVCLASSLTPAEAFAGADQCGVETFIKLSVPIRPPFLNLYDRLPPSSAVVMQGATFCPTIILSDATARSLIPGNISSLKPEEGVALNFIVFTRISEPPMYNRRLGPGLSSRQIFQMALDRRIRRNYRFPRLPTLSASQGRHRVLEPGLGEQA